MRVLSIGLLLAMWLSGPAGAQPTGQPARFENFPVTLDVLPREVTAPLAVDITTDQFRARLKGGGTVQLVGNRPLALEAVC